MKNRKKQIGTLADYVKANRKASREEEIQAHGKQVSMRPAVFKSKKVSLKIRTGVDVTMTLHKMGIAWPLFRLIAAM